MEKIYENYHFVFALFVIFYVFVMLVFFYEGKLKEVNYTYRADEVVNVKAVVYDIVDDNRIIIKKKGNDLYDYIALSKDQTKDLEIGKEYSFQLKVYRNTTSNNLTEIFQLSRVLSVN